MVDPLTAIAAVKQADEALGVIGKLLAKLRAQPDIAAVKLSAALDEIVKTYRVVDQAFNAYASFGHRQGRADRQISGTARYRWRQPRCSGGGGPRQLFQNRPHLSAASEAMVQEGL